MPSTAGLLFLAHKKSLQRKELSLEKERAEPNFMFGGQQVCADASVTELGIADIYGGTHEHYQN